jgi:hypothetical protein
LEEELMAVDTEHLGCVHDFNAHLVLAGPNPMEGGLLRCPEPGCPCESTWGVGDAVPSEELVAMLRAGYEEGVFHG